MRNENTHNTTQQHNTRETQVDSFLIIECIMKSPSIKFTKITSFRKHDLYDVELPFDDNGKPYGDDEREELIAVQITNCTKIPQQAFFCCDKLKIVIMDDFVEELGNNSFFRCFSLEYVRLSRNTKRIGRAAFTECKSLSSMIIPSGCREIGRAAFDGCKSLTLLKVPPSVQFVDISVHGCNKLIKHTDFATTDATEFQDFIRNRFKHLPLHQICSSTNLTDSEFRVVLSNLDSESCLDVDYQGRTALHILMANPHCSCHDTVILRELLKLCPKAGNVWDKFGKLPLHYLLEKLAGCSLELITVYESFCPDIQQIPEYSNLIANAYCCRCKASAFNIKVISHLFQCNYPCMDVSGLELAVADYLKHCDVCDL